MSAKYDVLLVSINDNRVRSILAQDLGSDESWAAVELWGKQLDCSNSFVIDDVTGTNKVGEQYRGFLSEAVKGFAQKQ